MDMKPLEVILFLLGFGSLLFLTYVTTRYIGGKSNKAMRGKYINVVETVSLGLDKRIHLVKAGEKYVLIASTSKSIEFLTTVEIEDGEVKGDEGPGIQNLFDFKAFFEKYMNSYKNKKNSLSQPDNDEISTSQSEGEKFRLNLDRLKTITRKTGQQVEKDGDDITYEK